MDPNGGINPSAPRLDNSQPSDIGPTPQFIDQPSMPSIPQEMPAAAPIMQEPQMFEAPQFQDVNAAPFPAQQQPMDPDPMLNQPMMDPAMSNQGGGSKKIIGILLTVVAGLAVVGGAAFAGYSMGKSAGRQEAAAEFQAQAAQQQEDIQNDQLQEEVSLDLTELKDPVYKNEELEGAVGEQINASDGFALQVTNIERGFTTEDPNYTLADSKELVKVNFVMGNFAKDKAKDISSFAFRMSDADGAELTPENIADYEGKFETVKIESGKQASGSIVFAVKKDSAPLTFTRSQTYRITNQNKEVTTKISVLVAE